MTGASSPAGGQPAGHIQEALRDGIATLTISNPARRNAMTLAMWRQLAASLARLREAPDLRVLALTGAGSQAFVSGADISEFDQARDSAEAAAVYNQTVAEAQDALARSGAHGGADPGRLHGRRHRPGAGLRPALCQRQRALACPPRAWAWAMAMPTCAAWWR